MIENQAIMKLVDEFSDLVGKHVREWRQNGKDEIQTRALLMSAGICCCARLFASAAHGCKDPRTFIAGASAGVDREIEEGACHILDLLVEKLK